MDSKVTDLSPLAASGDDALTDSANLYAAQSGDDWRLSVGILKAHILEGVSSGVTDHEALTGLQGGATGDHKHLTAAELARVPSSGEKAALVGTGTPSSGNKFVTADTLASSITAAIDALVAGAPTALDTLNEIANQLADDEDAVAALVTAINTEITNRTNADNLRIVGPSSATDGALVVFDGTTGKLAQNSAAIMGDATLSVFHEGGGETGMVPDYAGTTNGLASVVYGNDADVGAQIGLFRARGTKATPLAVTLGQRIGSWFAAAYNGTAFKAVAAIRAVATEAHTALANGTRLVFSVTKNGTVADGALDAKMALQHDGSLTIGGDLTPEPSAILELDSTTQGFLPSRLTTTQRDAVATPSTGLHIYNISHQREEFWNGIVWVGVGLHPQDSSITVNGNSEAWTDTGIDLTALDSLVLSASGSIDHGGGVFTDPNGGGGTLFGLPAYSLVGVVMASGTPSGGQAGSFFVGTSKGLVEKTGRLWLRFNDSTGTYAGNGGSFDVDLNLYQALQSGAGGGGGSGDVVGPATATDNAIPRFDGTTGKLLQNSGVTIDDAGIIIVPEAAEPTTPAAGHVAVYAKSDGKLYSKSDTGTEAELSGGGGGNSAISIDATGITSPLELDESQVGNNAIEITGALTGILEVIPPSMKGFVLKNSTIGGYSLRFKATAIAPKVAIGNNKAFFVFSDGTNSYGRELTLATDAPPEERLGGDCYVFQTSDSGWYYQGTTPAWRNESTGGSISYHNADYPRVAVDFGAPTTFNRVAINVATDFVGSLSVIVGDDIYSASTVVHTESFSSLTGDVLEMSFDLQEANVLMIRWDSGNTIGLDDLSIYFDS